MRDVMSVQECNIMVFFFMRILDSLFLLSYIRISNFFVRN